MGRIYIIFAVAMLFLMQFQAVADEPVRVTSAGKVVDINGKVLAMSNPSDSRNTSSEKYYSNLGPDGKPGATSDFYIILDPNKGFMRREIPQDKPNNGPNVSVNASINNQAHTGLTLSDDASRPVYDNMQSTGVVYGN